MFKSSHQSSYVWVKLVKKEHYISPSALAISLLIVKGVMLDHLLQWFLYLFGVVYIYLECFFFIFIFIFLMKIS